MAIKGLVADFEENGIKMSTEGFAAKRADHLLPERKRWPPKGQQQVLQQRDQITYILKAGDDHQKGQQIFLQQGGQITYFLKAGDGYQKVSKEFVMNGWSEYNMYIRNINVVITNTTHTC